jgi:hypothetical protein
MGAIFDHYTAGVILRRAGQDPLGQIDALQKRVERLERLVTFQLREFRGVMVYGNNGRLLIRPGKDQTLEFGSTNDSIKLAGGAGASPSRLNIYTGIP